MSPLEQAEGDANMTHLGKPGRKRMKKWAAVMGMAWLLWSDLTVIEKDNPLDIIMLRWLAGVPRLQTDRMRVDSFATAEQCKAGLERYMGTLKNINDSWSGAPFERESDVARIRYFRKGTFFARAELRCVEQ
jgi:hypothetical protein